MPEIKFHYQVSPHHQEIKADGAIGGLNPTSNRIVMSVYTERAPIPRVVVQAIDESGVVGEEIKDKREGKEGVVRAVQATLHMDADQAKALHQWLGDQIVLIERAAKGIKE